MFTLYFTAFFLAEEIFILLLDPKFYESNKIFQLIIIGYLFNSTFGILGLSFSQWKKMTSLMYITMTGGIINILLNIYYIPRFGIYGACYTTLISFIMVGIIKYIYAPKNSYVVFDWVIIIQIVFIMITISSIDYLLNCEHIYQKIILISPLYIFSFFKIKNLLRL